MAKIHITMSTGDAFTISNSFYGKSGPMADLKTAQVQQSFLFTEMASITTDQGHMVNVPQIAFSWIVE